jgi:phenylacetate-CoA ligase
VVVTSLFRSVPPFIRYDLRDRMALYPHAKCECGVCSQKLSALFGRIDEMVKLRGTNIYPMSCQGAVSRDQRTTGEFLCVVSTVGEGVARRDEMTVRVECKSSAVDKEDLAASLVAVLNSELGAKIDVEVVDPGALDAYSKSGEKPRRLLDLRKK